MNDIEREAIILNCAWKMIDGMVNWEIFVKNDRVDSTNLMFKTQSHSIIFSILLGDFLSEIKAFKGDSIPLGLTSAPSATSPSNLTFLFHLRQVCANPILGKKSFLLNKAVEEFAHWLEEVFTADGVNLSAINVVADFQISRYRYIKMCGDIAKHNLARLATNARYLRTFLETAGHQVNEQDAYLAIEDFFEWFHRNIFIYQSSQIAEFLNNIRWAIHDYLQAELHRSWHLRDDATTYFPMYSYRIPEGIDEPLAKAMYWDLMNRSRKNPYIHRFNISESMKMRY